jgi:exodeoxyribonuclease V alpha subunit
MWLSTVVGEGLIGVVRVHGGVKFYRGAAKAARAYVERDRSRADDCYLGEGTGVAERLTATREGVEHAGSMGGDTYEQWVAGLDVDGRSKKGRVLKDEHALRFVEVTVNGPKTWSLAAALHPEVSAALDAAQDRAASEIVGWVASHATTRVGPRGRQAQVPVEKVEAAVIRQYTSRAGDPHRHLHLQINARVYAAGGWRGIHSVGFRDSIGAINGIGYAAVATDPEFRAALAARGFTLDPATSEIRELATYAGAFSARTSQIRRNVDRYEAEWRREHPGEEPGPPGLTRGPTRWSRATVGSSSNGGTRNCAISAIAIRARLWRSEARSPRGSTETPLQT